MNEHTRRRYLDVFVCRLHLKEVFEVERQSLGPLPRARSTLRHDRETPLSMMTSQRKTIDRVRDKNPTAASLRYEMTGVDVDMADRR